MGVYLQEQRIATHLVRWTMTKHSATVTLATPETDTDTLTLTHRPAYWVMDELKELPGPKPGQTREVATVSEKEVLLALMQHGRVTQFAGPACTVQALREHIGLRQNIVTWASHLEWGWPEGGSAQWNRKLWRKGTPRNLGDIGPALRDALVQQSRYAIGCYAAAKLVYAHATLDYYRHVLRDKDKARLVEQRLLAGGDPLVSLEPARMWDFEEDYDTNDASQEGKLLTVQRGVASRNFVPGDWVYFLNTDAHTYAKTGYEGSNSIYLGRGKFSDYYNDNNHAYTYEQKLDEVYQWRNGVFSRSRHYERVQPLDQAQLERLSLTPEHGGLLLDLRATPYLFGFEVLPSLHR